MKMIDDNLTEEERMIEEKKGAELAMSILNGKKEKSKKLIRTLHNIDMLIFNGHTLFNGEVEEEIITPLMLTMKYNDIESMEYVLKEHGNPNHSHGIRIIDKEQIYRKIRPMLYAIYREKYEEVELLLKYNARINDRNYNNGTYVFASVYSGNYEITKLLIENGADVNLYNMAGYSPITLCEERIRRFNEIFGPLETDDQMKNEQTIESREIQINLAKIHDLLMEKTNDAYRV